MILLGLLLRGLARLFTRLAFLVLVVLTTLKVVSFAMALWAEHHPDTVERLAARMFGMPVHIARIETSWRGFTPRLWLRDLVLGDEEQLHVGDVLAGVSLGALPRWPDNLPVVLRLSGTRLQVERDEEGITRIVGLPRASGRFVPPALLIIDDATVEWTDRRRNVHLVERGLDLQLQACKHHRLLLVRSRQRDLTMEAEIEGRLTATDWSARFWIRGNGLEIASPLAAYLPPELSLQRATIDLEAWSYWKKGSHRATRLLFLVPEANLARRGEPPLRIRNLAGDLLFQLAPGGWHLQVGGFKLEADEAPPQLDTSLAIRARGDDLLLGIASLDLAAMAPLARLFPLPPEPRLALAAMAPAGSLEELLLHLQPREGAFTWMARARIRGIRTRPWKKLPGIRGLQGTFTAQPHQVRFILGGGPVDLEFPHLFRQPIELDRLEGELLWRRGRDGSWSLDSRRLVAENRDLHTVTRLHLQRHGSEPVHADIQTDFRDGDGRHASRYYPVGIMKKKLVDWLDRAIVFGRVPRGSFLLYGPLSGFPYHRQHNGHFEVLFQAEQLKLDYREGWPPLEEATGTVRFLDNSLQVELGRTRIFDSEVENAVARIPSLKPLAPLEVSGVVNGPLADELRLLRETPLRARLARHVEGIRLEGEGRLEARLHIPFRNHQYRFEGRLSFRDARFLWETQKLKIDHLSGVLEIDNRGIRGEKLQGETLGSKVRLWVTPGEAATRITAEGHIEAKALVAQYPLLALLEPAGSAMARLELDLPNYSQGGEGEILLQVRSKLEGVELSLPPPLEKKAGQPRELRFTLRASGEDRRYEIKLDDDLDLTLHTAGQEGARLSVSLSRLPLRPWTRWFTSIGEASGTSALSLRTIRLRTPRLEAPPLVAEKLDLALERSTTGWQGKVTSSTIRGRLRFGPDEESRRQRLWLELERLQLTTAADGAKAAPASPSPVVAPDPRTMALLTVDARKFLFNEADLGQLHIHTSPTATGQRIDSLTCTGGIARIEASGSWNETGEGQESHVAGTLNTGDMGRFLKQALGMDFLAGSKAYLSFDVDWPGAPFQFDLARLSGRMQLDMTAGRFLNIKPGAARILGLFNVQSLGRRLKFNFKDLYAKGLAFDTILGSFQLEDGLIYTNDLEINAPSATIRIAGSTNLATRTHDQLITVSPRLDATLPVAGAIAGGPVAGLVVLLAQQALSSRLEKIQRMRYSVTGSWDDPRVEPLEGKKATPPEEETNILEQ